MLFMPSISPGSIPFGYTVFYASASDDTNYPANLRDGDVAIIACASLNAAGFATDALNAPALVRRQATFNVQIGVTVDKVPNPIFQLFYSDVAVRWRALNPALSGAAIGGSANYRLIVFRPNNIATYQAVGMLPEGTAQTYNQSVNYAAGTRNMLKGMMYLSNRAAGVMNTNTFDGMAETGRQGVTVSFTNAFGTNTAFAGFSYRFDNWLAQDRTVVANWSVAQLSTSIQKPFRVEPV